jgi:hypothetical protein
VFRKIIIAAIAVVLGVTTVGCAADEAATSNSGTPHSTESGGTSTKQSQPEETVAEKNARQSAEDYLDTAPFSKAGLIQQLSSSYGEGFKKADAIYAVNHIDVNWNEQAAKAAKAYLDLQAFSRAGLIQQLESNAGDGYTHAQAVYGVNQTGL